MRKILRRLALGAFQIKIYLYRRVLSRNKVHGECKVVCPCLFMGAGDIRTGHGVQLGYHPSPYFYSGYTYVEARSPDANIEIGDRTIINNRAVLVSDGGGISIGRDCLIGTCLEIYDTDFHTLDPALRHKEVPKPRKVVVGDNVFIGSGVTILKGVHIGDNCVIGAGSVVTTSFPANVVIAGNPAVKIRDI